MTDCAHSSLGAELNVSANERAELDVLALVNAYGRRLPEMSSISTIQRKDRAVWEVRAELKSRQYECTSQDTPRTK